MKTPPRPKTAFDPMSSTLRASGDIGRRLMKLRQQLGPDLDAEQIVDDLDSLDTWLLGSRGPQAFVDQPGTALTGARYASCTLARMLGAPVPKLHVPRHKPSLPAKRRLSDIEVLAYRCAAVSHSTRAAQTLGALEQQASTVELAQIRPAHAVVRDEHLRLTVRGNQSKRPGTLQLADWWHPRVLSSDRKGKRWLLTDSKSDVDNKRATAITGGIARALDESLGWTRPSPKSIALTALIRVAEQHGFDEAHRISRNRERSVTEGELAY